MVREVNVQGRVRRGDGPRQNARWEGGVFAVNGQDPYGPIRCLSIPRFGVFGFVAFPGINHALREPWFG
jgi:hypothetical protein